MRKITNFYAYFECLFKNKYTRFAIIYMISGIIFFFLKFYISSAIFGIIGIVSFILTGFGTSSYVMYKRAMSHMLTYKQFAYSTTYCGTVGCNVARRRLRKKFPKDYEEMLEKENENEFAMFVIRVLFGGTGDIL